MKRKTPEVGQYIQHEEREGRVLNLLSAQFTYQVDDGNIFFCLYSEPWNEFKKVKGAKKKN